jgi:hypothetical protein
MMVINNRVHSKNITDKVFWYKAKPVPTFNVGCNKFRRFHDQAYDSQWNKRLEIFNPESLFSKKRNSVRVTVVKT